jgi:peptide/nickel transport system substrate-binding protein
LASKYAGATAATGALNGLYPCVSGQQVISADADSRALVSTMETLGYTYNEETGFYQDADGQIASISLLYYSDSADRAYTAELLCQQWASFGIEVTLEDAQNHETYLQMIQNKQFELYIGEMKLYNNMDLSPFWSGSARYGLSTSETLLAAYRAFRADAGLAGKFETAFSAEMPYIPLLWQGGVTVSTRRVSGVQTSVSDLYYSLAQLTVSH